MSVSELLADVPSVRDVILNAAAGTNARAMTHSWLFTGPPGSGRSNAALAFAAALVCTTEGEIGCGRCKSCRDALASQHTDVMHIVPKELTIKVKEVREYIAQAARMPTVAKWRVLIIENADRLGQDAADALLKTVEEPPAHTVIILCAPSTDPQDFSQTLRSRCRHLYIPQPSHDKVMRVLMEEEGASEPIAQLAAATSLRHLGRARLLVHNTTIQERRAKSIMIAEAVFHGSQAFQAAASLVKQTEKEAVEDHAEADAMERRKLEESLGVGAKGRGATKALRGASAALKELEASQKARGTRRKRDVFDIVLVDLAGVYRDALVLQSGAKVALTHPDFDWLAQEIAERVPLEGLVACQDAISQCRLRLHQQVSPLVAFNGMLGKIRNACNVN